MIRRQEKNANVIKVLRVVKRQSYEQNYTGLFGLFSSRKLLLAVWQCTKMLSVFFFHSTAGHLLVPCQVELRDRTRLGIDTGTFQRADPARVLGPPL